MLLFSAYQQLLLWRMKARSWIAQFGSCSSTSSLWRCWGPRCPNRQVKVFPSWWLCQDSAPARWWLCLVMLHNSNPWWLLCVTPSNYRYFGPGANMCSLGQHPHTTDITTCISLWSLNVTTTPCHFWGTNVNTWWPIFKNLCNFSFAFK